jgi:hypothetical protein
MRLARQDSSRILPKLDKAFGFRQLQRKTKYPFANVVQFCMCSVVLLGMESKEGYAMTLGQLAHQIVTANAAAAIQWK